MKDLLSILCLLLLARAPCSAFVVMPPTTTSSRHVAATTQKSMLPPDAMFLPEATNWIATIDADIAKLSDNEFAPIFAGGIAVMFGGVISATILGFILEKGDLYANVVADSYMQQGNDEEFWKGLSEEERIQGQEILRQLEAKNGKLPEGAAAPPAAMMMSNGDKEETKETAPKKEMDMFSDYE